MRRACRELLFELRHAMDLRDESLDMRLAQLADLDQIVPAQAAMAEYESGVNPLKVDPKVFAPGVHAELKWVEFGFWNKKESLYSKLTSWLIRPTLSTWKVSGLLRLNAAKGLAGNA